MALPGTQLSTFCLASDMSQRHVFLSGLWETSGSGGSVGWSLYRAEHKSLQQVQRETRLQPSCGTQRTHGCSSSGSQCRGPYGSCGVRVARALLRVRSRAQSQTLVGLQSLATRQVVPSLFSCWMQMATRACRWFSQRYGALFQVMQSDPAFHNEKTSTVDIIVS